MSLETRTRPRPAPKARPIEPTQPASTDAAQSLDPRPAAEPGVTETPPRRRWRRRADPSAGTRAARHGKRYPTRWTYWRRRILAVLAIVGVWVAWSIGGALAAPGTDGTAERVAQWARIHHLGWAITGAEKVKYQLFDKPETGGTVGAIPTVGQGADPTTSTATTPPAAPAGSPAPTIDERVDRHVVPTTPAPADITPIAAGSVPNEGVWQPMYEVNGRVAARATYLRPDAQHTGYLVGVVWMDPKLVSFTLHPGYNVPGGTGWAEPNQIPQKLRSRVLATFNSGFMMQDAHGAMWQKGHATGPLRQGGASMVITDDGVLDVVKWTGQPGPDVHSIRQNLVLMVDGGKVTPAVTNSSYTAEWGATIGNAAYVWRSAVGVRKDGSVLFVAGPAMSVQTLAALLVHVGAVRAMELDINPSWTNYITYTQENGKVTPHMFPQGAQPSPWRYLTPSTRDFVAVYPR